MYFLYFLTVLYLSLFSNENKKFFHLGSTTPYRFLENNNVTEPGFDGCVPKKIWMVTRHGTRNPGASTIKEININLTKLRDDIVLYSNLSLNLMNELKNWQLGLNKDDASRLREEGRIEMFLLGQRMQKRFPSLFPSSYSNQTFLFKYSRSERTNDSAQEFAMGLFGHEGSKNVQYDNTNNNDIILRFYKYCKKWITQVKKNPKCYAEKELFDEGSVMTSAVKALGRKLNLDNKLTTNAVKLMYIACGFETAWNKHTSIWCQFLSLQLMKILEFSDNLESYYIHGYGYDINYEQACPLFRDMYRHFTSKDLQPTTAVYFTHSGAILKFLALLGLYKNDQPLRHTDYYDNINKWSESTLDGFGSNVGFVLYRCGEEEKVSVFHQERIVKLLNCTELCDMKDLEQIYRKSIDCEFDKMCSEDTT